MSEPPHAVAAPDPATPSPQLAVARLLAILDLETIEVDLFRGQSTDPGWTRVFGGQVVAQALVAASRTVRADRLAHSLHAYFLRPGDPEAPIVYRVERERDGTSFATRRVAGVQHGKQIFSLTTSFQIAEDGFDHAAAMPRVAAPAMLKNEYDLVVANTATLPEPLRTLWTTRDRPIEIRPVEPLDLLKPKKTKPAAHVWLRAAAPVVADPVLARALLAYASDMTLLDTSLLPHGVTCRDSALQTASIDHAMWFHTTPDLNRWHLFAQDSPRAAGSRGFNRGQVFAEDGTLVASVAQEGLIRYRG